MIKEYKSYYSTPTFKNAKDLWQSIISYNYEEDIQELAEIRKHYSPRLQLTDKYLASNGTCLRTHHYSVGPYAEFWLDVIEDFIKQRPTNKFVELRNSIDADDEFRFHRVKLTSVLIYEYFISAKLHRPGAVDFIISSLEKIGPFALSTTPNNWLYLLSSPSFREFLPASAMTSGLSTGWELFAKQPPPGVHLNDNMVNWTTGMNFYTCPHGTKHFLPIFIPLAEGIVNLLNLTQPSILPTDDLMVIAPEIKTCSCGRKYQQFDFIPHINRTIKREGQTLYDLSLAEKLESSYINLQFMQVKNSIYVCHISNNGLDPIVSEFFTNHGFKVKELQNAFVELRGKYPVFWQTDSLRYRRYQQ